MRDIPALILLASLMAACAATPRYDDPIPVMLDRGRDPVVRVRAAQQAVRTLDDDPSLAVALEQALWEPGQPGGLRRFAAQSLSRRDAASFRQQLRRRLPRVDNWSLLEDLLDMIVREDWVELTPAVVRSYARPVPALPDIERPEHAALQALHPGVPVERVVHEVFADAHGNASLTEQVAAWELLNRLMPRTALLDHLASAEPATPLVTDLRATWRDLTILPTNLEGVLWLIHLREPVRASQWARLHARTQALDPAQRQGLDLRHLPVLDWFGDAALGKDRAAMLADLRRMLQGQEHHTIDPGWAAPGRERPQELDQVQDQLSWADLATIQALFHAVRQPRVVRELFQYAQRDLKDPSTEMGGVLDRRDGAFYFHAYAPLLRQHDRKFFPPPEMILHLYDSGVHVHLHAQKHDNADYAGPGEGDLAFARRLNFACLVMTFIDAQRLNVDYYQPNGAIVDLGTITRPW